MVGMLNEELASEWKQQSVTLRMLDPNDILGEQTKESIWLRRIEVVTEILTGTEREKAVVLGVGNITVHRISVIASLRSKGDERSLLKIVAEVMNPPKAHPSDPDPDPRYIPPPAEPTPGYGPMDDEPSDGPDDRPPFPFRIPEPKFDAPNMRFGEKHAGIRMALAKCDEEIPKLKTEAQIQDCRNEFLMTFERMVEQGRRIGIPINYSKEGN